MRWHTLGAFHKVIRAGLDHQNASNRPMAPSIQLGYASISYLFLWISSWWVAIHLNQGPQESAHAPDSGWLYLRRSLLILIALIGVTTIGGRDLAAFGWNWSVWIWPALGIGLLMGLANRGGFRLHGPVPVLLALFHTFAIELYFRGYLFHHLRDLIGIWALLVSALLYGIYYTTAHTVWIAGPRGRLIGATTFAILGLIFAGWYSLSGSFLAAWLAHFGAVIRLGTRHRSPPTQEVPL
jgi:hypothetical protein